MRYTNYPWRKKKSPTQRRGPNKKEEEALHKEQVRRLSKCSLATLRAYLDPNSQINVENAKIATMERRNYEIKLRLSNECAARVSQKHILARANEKYADLHRDYSHFRAEFNGMMEVAKQRTFWGKPTKPAVAAMEWITKYNRFMSRIHKLEELLRDELLTIWESEQAALSREVANIPVLPRPKTIPPLDIVREAIAIREKEESLRAAAAKNTAEQRDLADVLKLNLPRNHPCPYCGCSLGDFPHADHIYPVSKGGRSTFKNMVYICAPCNSLKSNLTLRAFAKSFNYSFEQIELRLTDLGKDF